MTTAVSIHLLAAGWALAAGLTQLVAPKGTVPHRVVGWSWMLAMALVAVSSFWLTGFMALLWGYGPIHLLSLWVLVCLVVSIHAARRGAIRRHRGFAVGALIGLVGAGAGAFVPGRLLHGWLLGG